MAAMRASLEGTSGGGEWTDRNPALRRALLRTEKFLATEDADASGDGVARAGKRAEPSRAGGR